MAAKQRRTAATIFADVWAGPGGKLTPALARHVINLQFGDEDRTRMRELLRRNSEGGLTAEEMKELADYDMIGDVIAILQAKARAALKEPAPARNGHG